MSIEELVINLTAAVIDNTKALREALGVPFEAGAETAEPAKRRRRSSNTTESGQPAASVAAPGATAPATGGPLTQSPAAPDLPTAAEIEQIVKLSGKSGAPLAELQQNLRSAAGLLVAATEAIIVLAGGGNRETAVGILGKRKVTRCSELPADQHRAVLNEALQEIAKVEALKAQATANASLV